MSQRALLVLVLAFSLGETAPAAEEMLPEAKLRRTPLEHFVLLSEREITHEDKNAVRGHLMRVRRRVGRDFVHYPDRKIEVILSEKETFKAYTGLPAHVGGLYDGKIHLPLPSVSDRMSLESILWHEYTHAVVSELTHGKIPRWLNEGFGFYQEAKILKPDLALLKDAVRSSGALPYPMEELDGVITGSLEEDPQAVRLAYEQSYGFVSYLFSRYSRAVIREFLEELAKDGDVRRALSEKFNLSPRRIEDRWLEHLRKLGAEE